VPNEYAVALSYVPNNIINADLTPVYFYVESGTVSVIPSINETVTLVSAATSPNDFISIVETSMNSRMWVLSFTVTETYSNEEIKVVPYAIHINANNANVDGRYNLGLYTLIYDIRGNGSNIREFRVVMN